MSMAPAVGPWSGEYKDGIGEQDEDTQIRPSQVRFGMIMCACFDSIHSMVARATASLAKRTSRDFEYTSTQEAAGARDDAIHLAAVL